MAHISSFKNAPLTPLKGLLIKVLLIVGFSTTWALQARALEESNLCTFKPLNINADNLKVSDNKYTTHDTLDKELMEYIEEALKDELFRKLEKYVVDKSLIIISEQLNSKVFNKLVLETYPKILYYANVLNTVFNGSDKDKAYLAANTAIQSMSLSFTGEVITTTILTIMQIIDYSKDKAHYEQLKEIYEEINSITNQRNNNLQKYSLIFSIKISLLLEEYYFSKINLDILNETIGNCPEDKLAERKRLFAFRQNVMKRELEILNNLLSFDEKVLMLATNNIMTHSKISKALQIKIKNLEESNHNFILINRQIQNLNFDLLKLQLSLLDSTSDEIDMSFDCATLYHSVLERIIGTDKAIVLKDDLDQCKRPGNDFASSLIKNTVFSQLKTMCEDVGKYYQCHAEVTQ